MQHHTIESLMIQMLKNKIPVESDIPTFRDTAWLPCEFLAQQGFTDWREIDGVIYAVMPYSISNGRLFVDVNECGYTEFYCFCSPEAARKGLFEWKPETEKEPTGWHRHSATGRRRENGDPSKETIYW